MQVMYLQEEPFESNISSNSASEFLQPDYVTTRADLLFRTALTAKRYIIILSSVTFAAEVLQQFGNRLIGSMGQPPYEKFGLLFGDFWGDPTKIRSVLDHILSLEDEGHALFGLRNAVNGTDKFQEHMGSIHFNDSRFQSNPFLQKFWETHFSCSIADGSCKLASAERTFPRTSRPILRNYKAPLIIDAASVLRKYIQDYQQKFSKRPAEFFRNDFYKLKSGDVLEVNSKWTGNRWLFGIPYGSADFVDWVQPLEWGYEIMELFFNRNDKNRDALDGNLYATWRINKGDKIAGILSLVNPSTSESPLDHCLTSCDSKSLYSMSSLVFIVLTLLILVCITWVLRVKDSVNRAKDVIKSPGVVIFGFCTILSIAVSLWMIFGGEAVDCESRVDDFLVTVINNVSFTVLLIFLTVLLVTNRLMKMALKVFGFPILVSIQIAISAVAHLMPSEDSYGEDRVKYCFDERKKPLAVVSYMYSDVSFTVCILLILCNLWLKWGDFSKSNKQFKFISASLALSLWIVYTLMVVFLVFLDDRSCTQMGQIFITVAVFPSILCLFIIMILLLSKLDTSEDDDEVFNGESQPCNDLALFFSLIVLCQFCFFSGCHCSRSS